MKMLNKSTKKDREITKELVVSFFFGATFIFLIEFFFESKINIFFTLFDTISIKETVGKAPELVLNKEEKLLKNYPDYGTIYATLKIPSIGVENKLFHGDTMDILRKGLGHYAGSYFPGENGTILIAGHNTAGFLRTLPQIKNSDEIIIEADYGIFKYEVYNAKVLSADVLNEIEIKNDQEELVIYTCYPLTIGHPKTRYVVYARRIS